MIPKAKTEIFSPVDNLKLGYQEEVEVINYNHTHQLILMVAIGTNRQDTRID